MAAPGAPAPVLNALRVDGKSVLGFSSAEQRALSYASKEEVARIQNHRAIQGAQGLARQGREVISVPADTSKDLLNTLQSSFPTADFARAPVAVPHHIARAARYASVDLVAARLNQLQPQRVILVGPSHAQARRLSQPGRQIIIYQPLEDGRDRARWADAEHFITHQAPYGKYNAVSADIVVCLLSVGSFPAQEFVEALATSEARHAFVLQHFCPAALYLPQTDALTGMQFERRGVNMLCAFPDSAGYVDSAEVHEQWANGLPCITGVQVTTDILARFGSLTLLDITVGYGAVTPAPLASPLLDDLVLLPKVAQYNERLVDRETFDSVVLFLRRAGRTASVAVALNRLAALNHKVTIGDMEVMRAHKMNAETQEHIAEAALRKVILQDAKSERNSRRAEQIASIEREASNLEVAARAIDGKFGLALAGTEFAARTVLNFTPAVAITSKLFTGSWKAVDFSPITGTTAQSSLTEGIRGMFSTQVDQDLLSLSSTPTRIQIQELHGSFIQYKRSAIIALADVHAAAIVAKFGAPRAIQAAIEHIDAFGPGLDRTAYEVRLATAVLEQAHEPDVVLNLFRFLLDTSRATTQRVRAYYLRFRHFARRVLDLLRALNPLRNLVRAEHYPWAEPLVAIFEFVLSLEPQEAARFADQLDEVLEQAQSSLQDVLERMTGYTYDNITFEAVLAVIKGMLLPEKLYPNVELTTPVVYNPVTFDEAGNFHSIHHITRSSISFFERLALHSTTLPVGVAHPTPDLPAIILQDSTPSTTPSTPHTAAASIEETREVVLVPQSQPNRVFDPLRPYAPPPQIPPIALPLPVLHVAPIVPPPPSRHHLLFNPIIPQQPIGAEVLLPVQDADIVRNEEEEIAEVDIHAHLAEGYGDNAADLNLGTYPPSGQLGPDLTIYDPDTLLDNLLEGPFELLRPFSEPTETNAFDLACTTPYFEDFHMGAFAFDTYPHGSIPTEHSAGPESLYRTIAHCLLGRATPKRINTEVRRSIQAFGRLQAADENGQRGENWAAMIMNADPESRVDVAVDALPAAAKSTIAVALLQTPEHNVPGTIDVIVTPTNELAAQWNAKLSPHQRKHVRVVTQHVALVIKEKIRLMVIDEAYIFELAHVTAMIRRARRAIAIGDVSQIVGFNVRDNGTFPFLPRHANAVIRAPYSLGLPVDVLILGKMLGYVPSHARTANATCALKLLDHTRPTVGKLIVFNQNKKDEVGSVTAHESQGSRYGMATVRCTDEEQHFVPSHHFWTAVSRATEVTELHLSAGAWNNLRMHINIVNGLEVVEKRFVEAMSVNFTQNHVIESNKHLCGAITASTDRYGIYSNHLEYLERLAPEQSDGQFIDSAMDVPPIELVNDALMRVNMNRDALEYSDVAELSDLALPPNDSAVALTLDLQSSGAHTTSTLNPAGVLFQAKDTITELFTIGKRYLKKPVAQTLDPIATGDVLLNSFCDAFIDPDKVAVMGEEADGLIEWFKSREKATFQPGDDSFGVAQTTTFRSFMKSHAKAKNDVGFGQQLEKGQTIAAGDQSYNAVYSAWGRKLHQFLLQILCDDFILDISHSEKNFAQRCKDLSMYSLENTQIDLSSQDSTHHEHHVLVLCSLLSLIGCPGELINIYYHMRKRYSVVARNYGTDSRVKYSTEWTLPSGDPFTLIANCIHEMCSTAYVFGLHRDTRGPGCAKGDDQYYKRTLIFSTACRDRAQQIGVIFKLDYGLPPFFAGRFILHDNSVYYDPVKVVAKFAIRRIPHNLQETYAQAYHVLLPQVTAHHLECIIQAASVHHPHMSLDQVDLLARFAFSLKHLEFLRAFQRPPEAIFQLYDVNGSCAMRTLMKLGHTLSGLPRNPTPAALLAHCRQYNIPHKFLRDASHTELIRFSANHPLVLVFSLHHALAHIAVTTAPTDLPRHSQLTSFARRK